MIKISFILLIALLSGLILSAWAANESSMEPLPELLQRIDALQRRADKLAFGEIGANNYHLAKARTWLDMALSEYYENEGNDIVDAASAQAEDLLDGLEKNQGNIPMNTPIEITGSEAVRPDLWGRIDKLKRHKRFSCGQRAIAEAEVHLVWAGHEKLESSWSHAESYANSAVELLKEAQTSINKCVAQIPTVETITLSSDVLFGFNQAEMEPSEQWRLNRLSDSIKTTPNLEEIILVGHTDRLRSDGRMERNQILSEQRAESIRRYLIKKGLAPDKIHASGVGSTQPRVQCPTKTSKAAQIVCLQPNRRVEITLRGAL